MIRKSDYPQPHPEKLPVILLVEDDILQRIVLADWLRSLHYVVHEAASTDEASTLLASPLITIDLVITDILLPGRIDGMDLKNYIRRVFPHIPIIIVSSAVSEYDIHDVADFFSKPYDFEALAARIAELLSQKRDH